MHNTLGLFFMSTSSWWHGALPLGENDLGVLLENVVMLLQALIEHFARPKHPLIALSVPGNWRSQKPCEEGIIISSLLPRRRQGHS